MKVLYLVARINEDHNICGYKIAGQQAFRLINESADEDGIKLKLRCRVRLTFDYWDPALTRSDSSSFL